MPTVQMPLVSYEETISEPLKKQICDMIGGDINYVNSAGNKLTNSEGIDLDNRNEARVVIEETDLEDTHFNSNVTANNIRYSVIEDGSIGLAIKIADIKKKLVFSVSKRFATRGDAIWWRNSILGQLKDGTTNHAANLHISPSIPSKLLELVEECRIRKEQRGYNVGDFMTYLLSIAAKNMTLDTNSTKSSVAVTFPELLENVVFTLPTEAPTPTFEDGKYLLEFTFQATVKLPTSCTVKYPNYIGGIPMPDSMVDKEVDVNWDEDETITRTTSGIALDWLLTFKGHRNAHYRPYCYQLPPFEDYRFEFSNWNLAPIFQVRMDADPNDPRHVVNIGDLFAGPIMGFELDPNMFEYIKTFPKDVTNINTGAISIILMKGREMVTNDRLYIDSRMNLRVDYDLDMIGDYHLVITTPLQTAAIPEHIFDSLYEFPKLTNDLIKHTNPTYPYDKLPEAKYVTRDVYRPIFNEILGSPEMTGPLTANSLVVNS